MFWPLELAGWVMMAVIGIFVLPVVLDWIPVIVDFLVNLVLWLVWVLKYRNSK